MSTLPATVVICTHNREQYLPKAIQSLVGQTFPKDAFEIIVVDNASTDGTKAIVCEQFRDVPNLRYMYEPEMGLAHARNTGWRNAHGKIVAYLDDDAIASPRWLETIMHVYETVQPAPGCVGGRIEPIWEGEPPDWMIPQLAEALAVIDWSNTPHFLPRSEWLAGCNMACPRHLIEKIEGFWPYLDRQGTRLLSNGDTLLQSQIAAIGYPTYYHPDVSVRHHVPVSRLSKKWFVRRGYWQGISDAVMKALTDGSTRARVRRAIVSFRELCKPRRMRALLLPAGDGPQMYEKYLAWQFVGQIRANLFWRNERP